jgi:hypothetical protein
MLMRSTLPSKTNAPCAAEDLVAEVPGGTGSAYGLVGQSTEGGGGQIDGVTIAAIALVDNFCGGGLAAGVGLDGDHPAAVRVVIGFSSHELKGKGNDALAIG